MSTDLLLDITWNLAENEARSLGSRIIEPVHFLLAALKIVDPEFPKQLDGINITTEEWKTACKEALKVRHYLDVLPNNVCLIRRRLRRRLARANNPPVSMRTQIHRSRKTCAAFFDANARQKNNTITLLQLMHSMFELGFIDVSDMRLRGETQTRIK